MMEPGDVIAAVAFFGMLIAVVCVGGVSFQRWVSYKQRKAELDAEARRATLSERGDYVEMLEQRVRVLERIATDRGVDLAAQIESLRTDPAVAKFADEELN
ncbi:MAG TPA: hypothetical protein VLM18_02265 [Croceibacterium sp.]|nr:hypothetical protein [Croceibacterium sp.]